MNWEAISSVATAIGTLVALIGISVQGWSAASLRKRRTRLVAWELAPLVIRKKVALLHFVEDVRSLLEQRDAVIRGRFHEIAILAERLKFSLDGFDRGELAELPGPVSSSIHESIRLTEVLVQRVQLPSVDISHRKALELVFETAQLLVPVDWRISDDVELLIQDISTFDRYVQRNFREHQMERALARVVAGEASLLEAAGIEATPRE